MKKQRQNSCHALRTLGPQLPLFHANDEVFNCYSPIYNLDYNEKPYTTSNCPQNEPDTSNDAPCILFCLYFLRPNVQWNNTYWPPQQQALLFSWPNRCLQQNNTGHHSDKHCWWTDQMAGAFSETILQPPPNYGGSSYPICVVLLFL